MQVFLSYTWSNSEEADIIQKMCQRVGIKLIRDKFDLRYSENIPKFAEKINECDFVICLVSDEYVKSYRCMFEAVYLLKLADFEKKICTVSVSSSNLRTDAKGRTDYINYWDKKVFEINDKIKDVDKKLRNTIDKDLSWYEEIRNNVDAFLYYVDNHLYVSTKDIQENGISAFIKTIVYRMGFMPYAHIEYLADISEMHDISQQEDLLEKYYRDIKENEYFYYVKANIYERNKYKDLALYYYKKSVEFNPEYVLAYEAIINLLLNEDNTDFETIYHYLDVINKLEPDSSCVLRINGILSIRKKDFNVAIEFLKKYLNKRPTDFAIYNTLAVVLEKLGSNENILAAKNNYEKAIQLNKQYYQAYNNLAIWYLKYEEDYEKCIYYCDKCLEMCPTYYYAYNVKGLALVELNEYEKAFDELCESLLLSPPQHPLPINNMGYLIEKRFESFDIAQYFYAFMMDKNNLDAYLNYAMVDFKQNKDYKAVVKTTQEGIKLDDKNLLLKFLQALAFYELGNFEHCLKLCDECIYIDDSYWPAYFMKIYLEEDSNKLLFKTFPESIKETIEREFANQSIEFTSEGFSKFYNFICNHFNEFSKTKINREIFINIQNLNDIRKRK